MSFIKPFSLLTNSWPYRVPKQQTKCNQLLRQSWPSFFERIPDYIVQLTAEERKEVLQYTKEELTSEMNILRCDDMLDWEYQGQRGGLRESFYRLLWRFDL